MKFTKGELELLYDCLSVAFFYREDITDLTGKKDEILKLKKMVKRALEN